MTGGCNLKIKAVTRRLPYHHLCASIMCLISVRLMVLNTSQSSLACSYRWLIILLWWVVGWVGQIGGLACSRESVHAHLRDHEYLLPTFLWLWCRWYVEEEEDEDVVSFWVIIIELSGLEEQQQLKELLFPNWFIGRDFIIITAIYITVPPTTTVIDRKYVN